MEQNLILGPYKEPLRKVEGGYGYLGALTLTTQGEIQCHVCGKTMHNLSMHVKNVHKISAADYRQKYKLAAQTRLISEELRSERKLKFMRWWASLDGDQRREHRARMHKGLQKYLEKNNGGSADKKVKLETKNKRGVCPDQLLDLIQRAAKELGTSCITESEFIAHYGSSRYSEPIRKTYGSWNAAVKRAGLVPNKSTGNRWTKPHYEDEELLDLLRDYYLREERLPSKTDFMRGLLPSYDTYRSRFGTIAEARRLAGLPEENPWRTRKRIQPQSLSTHEEVTSMPADL